MGCEPSKAQAAEWGPKPSACFGGRRGGGGEAGGVWRVKARVLLGFLRVSGKKGGGGGGRGEEGDGSEAGCSGGSFGRGGGRMGGGG